MDLTNICDKIWICFFFWPNDTKWGVENSQMVQDPMSFLLLNSEMVFCYFSSNEFCCQFIHELYVVALCAVAHLNKRSKF